MGISGSVGAEGDGTARATRRTENGTVGGCRLAILHGGLEATQLDLTSGSEDIAFGPSGLAEFPTLGFGAHQMRRVYVVRANGGVVVIGLSPVKPEDDTPSQLAAAIDILQPIVDSITWQ